MASERYVRAGGAAVNNTYIPAEFVPTGVNEMARNFVANYTRRFGSAPDPFAAEGYTMMLVIANAIRTAGANPTRDAIRQAIAATRDLPGVLGQGRISIDENRVPSFGSVVLALRDGRWVQP
jgi:branched-chain amino acid transport system substrate-binding protein